MLSGDTGVLSLVILLQQDTQARRSLEMSPAPPRLPFLSLCKKRQSDKENQYCCTGEMKCRRQNQTR